MIQLNESPFGIPEAEAVLSQSPRVTILSLQTHAELNYCLEIKEKELFLEFASQQLMRAT